MTLSSRLKLAWPCELTFVYAAGYALAVCPPITIDPTLKSHLSFPGGRHYDAPWRAILIGALVVAATFYLARRLVHPMLIGLPLLSGTIATNLLIMPQEFPHAHLFFVTFVWVAMGAIWTWVRYSEDEAIRKASEERANAVEFIKEQTYFFRTLATGLVGGFLGLLVAATLAIHDANGKIDSDPGEVFRLQRLADATLGAYALLLLFGPVREAVVAWRRLVLLLLPDRPKVPTRKRRAGINRLRRPRGP